MGVSLVFSISSQGLEIQYLWKPYFKFWQIVKIPAEWIDDFELFGPKHQATNFGNGMTVVSTSYVYYPLSWLSLQEHCL